MTFTFTNVRDTIGNATLTYSYKNDDIGTYSLEAGTKLFKNDLEEPACVEQQTAVTVTQDVFNSGGDLYMKQDGVLNVYMVYVPLGDNTCASENLGKVRLEYQYFDCGSGA